MYQLSSKASDPAVRRRDSRKTQETEASGLLDSQRGQQEGYKDAAGAKDILYLQRAIGNKATSRMLQQGLLSVQPKLKLGKPGDKYEQEADQTAKMVVQSLEHSGGGAVQKEGAEEEEELQAKMEIGIQRQEEPEEEDLQAKLDDAVQRQEEPEEEELQAKPEMDIQRQEEPEEEELQAKLDDAVQRQEEPEEEELQAKLDDAVQRQEEPEEEELQAKPEIDIQRQEEPAEENLEASIQQARGSGQPMDPQLQAKMENAFSSDFSKVKVHTDSQSDRLNRSIGARAFTTGHDIFFKQGEYNPGANSGQELIAHELTHVVQQNGPSVQRKDIQRAPGATVSNRVSPGRTRFVQAGVGDFFKNLFSSKPKPAEAEPENETDKKNKAAFLKEANAFLSSYNTVSRSDAGYEQSATFSPVQIATDKLKAVLKSDTMNLKELVPPSSSRSFWGKVLTGLDIAVDIGSIIAGFFTGGMATLIIQIAKGAVKGIITGIKAKVQDRQSTRSAVADGVVECGRTIAFGLADTVSSVASYVVKALGGAGAVQSAYNISEADQNLFNRTVLAKRLIEGKLKQCAQVEALAGSVKGIKSKEIENAVARIAEAKTWLERQLKKTTERLAEIAAASNNLLELVDIKLRSATEKEAQSVSWAEEVPNFSKNMEMRKRAQAAAAAALPTGRARSNAVADSEGVGAVTTRERRNAVV